jgi:hypothetical protein
LNAQAYQTLPDSNVSWVIQNNDSNNGDSWYNYSTPINKDTIINAKTYSKIFEVYPTENYTGAFRSDTSGKTFFVPKDSLQEFLLQDLSKNTGDSVYNVYYGIPGGDQINFYVDSTSYITIGPYLLKKMFLSPAANLICDATCGGYSLIWIEKIGSVGGGLFNNITIGLGISWLNCMSFNDTIYYYKSSFPGPNPDTFGFYTYGRCGDDLGLNELNQIYDRISLSPNPVNNESAIKLGDIEDLIYEIEIYNSQGEKIKENKNVNNVTFQIKKLSFSAGIYIVKVITKKRKKYSMKFIVL